MFVEEDGERSVVEAALDGGVLDILAEPVSTVSVLLVVAADCLELPAGVELTLSVRVAKRLVSCVICEVEDR